LIEQWCQINKSCPDKRNAKKPTHIDRKERKAKEYFEAISEFICIIGYSRLGNFDGSGNFCLGGQLKKPISKLWLRAKLG